MSDHPLVWKHDGLSPSSLQLFQQCQRKYFLKKIEKVPIDSDAEDDTEAFRVGKAFHLCLEVTRHELSNFKFSECRDICVNEFGLSEDYHAPMVFAMLAQYKKVHEKSGLSVLGCEIPIDTLLFKGIVDVVLGEGEGWWIGDMKTAASFSERLLPTIPRHQQLNLYADHADDVAEALGLDPRRFLGVRYRLTTKSRLVRRKDEDTATYFLRLSNVVKSLDLFVRLKDMAPEEASLTHLRAKMYVDKFREERSYVKNESSCMSYNRPCEFWSRCHAKIFSECASTLGIIEADDRQVDIRKTS